MVETYFNIIFFKKKDWSDGFKKITFPDKFFLYKYYILFEFLICVYLNVK